MDKRASGCKPLAWSNAVISQRFSHQASLRAGSFCLPRASLCTAWVLQGWYRECRWDKPPDVFRSLSRPTPVPHSLPVLSLGSPGRVLPPVSRGYSRLPSPLPPSLELKSTYENTFIYIYKENSKIGKQHHWIGSSSFK